MNDVERADYFSDEAIMEWEHHIAAFYPKLSSEEAQEFISEARGPAWKLAASLGRLAIDVAFDITKAIHG